MPTHTPPALVGVGSGPLAGQRFDLPNGYLPLGRAHGSFIYIGLPGVASEHAALTVNGASASVLDLGTTEGTFVNGRRIQGSQELRGGDMVRISGVEMQFVAAEPATTPASSPDAPPPSGGGFDVGSVYGSNYNVVGNVYQQRRDSLLREVAAARTRGRVVIGVGAVLFVIGLVMFAAPIVRGLGARAIPRNPFGPEILGIPSGVLGWALAGVGVLVVVLGIVLHVTATARRRRIYRGEEVPPPGPQSQPRTGWSG